MCMCLLFPIILWLYSTLTYICATLTEINKDRNWVDIIFQIKMFLCLNIFKTSSKKQCLSIRAVKNISQK